MTTNGYKTIWNNEKRINEFEHRVIMENFLKRKLLQGEQIHHINGIKTDNRIENLIVMSIHEHSSLHGKEYWKDKQIFCSVCGKPQKAKGLCSNHYEQSRHIRVRPPKTSKYKGVSFDNMYQKWAVNICREGNVIFRKKFNTEEEAFEAYNITIKNYEENKRKI